MAKVELYHDNFQNFKRYNIPKKAQLVIADIPYNIGVDAYASNPMWYAGGDNKNGESKHAKSSFFNSDGQFKIAEYMHFCNRLLIKEPKEKGKAPAMIVFCAFEQIPTVIEYGKKYGFMNNYPIFFIKTLLFFTIPIVERLIIDSNSSMFKILKFNLLDYLSTKLK